MVSKSTVCMYDYWIIFFWCGFLLQPKSSLQQVRTCEMMLGLAFITHENVLVGKTKIKHLGRTGFNFLFLELNFAKRILSSSKYSHTLPVNSTNHTVTFRNNNKVVKQHFKANRMFYSSIPYMKHLLNS